MAIQAAYNAYLLSWRVPLVHDTKPRTLYFGLDRQSLFT